MSETVSSAFQTGGSLPPDNPYYVSRRADDDLYTSIINGEFCYILAARQMGKSSLCVRTMKRLLNQNIACCSIDLTKLGVYDIDAETWYWSLIDVINHDLNLRLDISAWWEGEKPLSPVYRFFKFIRYVVKVKTNRKIVIFFDEIDSIFRINGLMFSSDDFFAGIRAIYNARANEGELNRIVFVITGVASPNDLIDNAEVTPFNIGKSVSIDNFSLDEAKVFTSGLQQITHDPDELLKEIFFWTNGQPILTHQVCKSLSSTHINVSNIKSLLNDQVQELFLNRNISSSENSNFLNIQNRIVENEMYGMEMLKIYDKLRHSSSVMEDSSSLAQLYLKLSGLVRSESGHLKINNKLYKVRFDGKWIDDIRSLIHRPFKDVIRLWLENDKSEEYVIEGAALSDYISWSSHRNDLTYDEIEFQRFCNRVAIVKTVKAQIIADLSYSEILKKREERDKQDITSADKDKTFLQKDNLFDSDIENALKSNEELLKFQKRYYQLLIVIAIIIALVVLSILFIVLVPPNIFR